MKLQTLKKLLSVICTCFLMLPSANAQWVDDTEPVPASEDKTLSPYFLVRSASDKSEAFPLKGTKADVHIAGVIADVIVTQNYKNEGDSPIEATYVFPASTRAAVYAMQMTIGDRIIEAKVKERTAAKKEYNEAKKEGKSASLLEQNRPNVFQMSVANIMPGDEVKVELRYTELLSADDSIYEFTYPTVVGPRYSNQKAETASQFDQWVKNPFLHQFQLPTSSFNLSLSIDGGLPIKELASTTHKVNVSFDSPAKAKVLLDPSEEQSANKDFILRYRLTGEEIDGGVALYEGDTENFLLLNIQPPEQVTQDIIPARDYIFVIDVSGSMNGFPLNTAKALLKNLIGNLRHNDTFNVLLFSGDSAAMSEKSLPATEDNIRKAISLIEDQRGAGGTEIVPALRRCFSLPRESDISRSIIVITDGYVHVEREVFNLISENLGNANVFSFGIGSSVNRYLIEGIARAGGGEPFVLTRPSQAEEIARKFKEYIDSPVLTSVKLKVDGANIYDVEPAHLPDLFGKKPIYVFGKYRGKPHGKLTLEGRNGAGFFERRIDLSDYKADKSNIALKYLWARHKIGEVSDFSKLFHDSQSIKEIVELGLKYNLLTEHTSFVAVDQVVRNTTGKLKSVKQPLPLPEGVSDFAVGGGIPSAPEPEVWALLLMASLVFYSMSRNKYPEVKKCE